MPTYDYECLYCGSFEVVRAIDERNLPVECDTCGAACHRVMVAAPRLATMSTDQRIAFSTNERASHEPKHSSNYGHPSGCSCCKPNRNNKQAQGSNHKDATDNKPVKSFANKRPWMISH